MKSIKFCTTMNIMLMVCICWNIGIQLDPVIKIKDGLIRGTYLTSNRSNRTYLAFMGIPYAKPPVGQLRFESPQPVKPWIGILNTTKEGSVCPQLSFFVKVYQGQEDCLYINVYTPKLPSDTLDSDLPVMVWIHGGGFVFGSGNRSIYGPDYFIDEDVVVVSFNYRLGVLGFLSLQNAEVPGNNGLKDQVQALKWVQSNIRKFGGNPDQVTIFGQSSGGASVQYHTHSPMSQGLFHRAISESGSSLNPWAFQTQSSAVQFAFDLANKLGPRTEEKQEVLNRLKNASVKWLVTNIGIFSKGKGAVIGPTVDAVAGAGESFLPDLPINLINEGKIHNVSYIIGMTNGEGILATYQLKATKWFLKNVMLVLEMILPYIIGPNLRDKYGMAMAIKNKYFSNTTEPLMLQYMDVLTDLYFGNGAYCAAQKYAVISNSSVFSYEFEFNGTANVIKMLLGGNEFSGACHGDELPYLFTFELLGVKIKPGTPEYLTSTRMIRLWTNFAKTGNPTPKPESLLQNIKWNPVDKSSFPYLSINKNLKMEQDLNYGRPYWWEKQYSNFVFNETSCWPLH